MTKDVSYQEIRDLPVNSAILQPADGEIISSHATRIHLRGEAHSGGGRGILRVDVSIDGGKTWHNAHLNRPHQNC